MAQNELNVTQNELSVIQGKLDRAENEKEDIRKEFTIYRYVNKLLKSQKTESEIIASLASGFLLEREEAERALKKVLEEDT